MLVEVSAGFVDRRDNRILTVFPNVWIIRIGFTDVNRIFEVIRRMNNQVEVDNTIASRFICLSCVFVVTRDCQMAH